MDDETEGKTLVQGYTAHWWQVREGKPPNFGDRVTKKHRSGRGRKGQKMQPETVWAERGYGSVLLLGHRCFLWHWRELLAARDCRDAESYTQRPPPPTPSPLVTTAQPFFPARVIGRHSWWWRGRVSLVGRV